MTTPFSRFLASLTDEQQAVVRHGTGHARVSAVAGSGKTTTMIGRIGELLNRGVDASKIMVLMFNRSARDGFERSMNHRLGCLGRQLPEIRTFHSLGARLVESFVRRRALVPFRLETRDSVQEKLARQAANSARREQGGETAWLAQEELEEFLTFIDLVKASLGSASSVLKQLNGGGKRTWFLRGFEIHEELRREQGIRFYADLIGDPVTAMEQDGELRAWVSDRVDHIIVDEYQDINEVQQQLLQFVAGRRAQVMAVGDVDQCIYEWRGARPEYLTDRFARDFPNPKNYLLSCTFRYGHQLSLAANHLIGENRKRDRKLCVSHPANPNTRLSLRTEEVGLHHPVAGILAKWQARGRSLAEAAILVRLWAQTVPVELALLDAGIPYRFEGGVELFGCSEILALTGYCHLAAGSLAGVESGLRTEMLEAMFSQPHLGIPQERLRLLAATASGAVGDLPELLLDWAAGDLPEFLKKRFTGAAENFRWVIDYGRDRADIPAHQFLTSLVGRFDLFEFYRNLASRPAAGENRVKTCQALIDFARGRNFGIQELLRELETLRTRRDASEDGILVTSVHRAKGLEWPLVILPGLENGSFPFCRGREEEGFEDERRLFYVAMTRAREWLVCCHPPESAFLQAQAKFTGCATGGGRVSRFLKEARPGLSRELGEIIHGARENSRLQAAATPVAAEYLKAVGKEVSFVTETPQNRESETQEGRPLTMDEIVEGQLVMHPTFGEGVVTAIRDRKQGRLLVDFEGAGEVMLLAAYARLREAV